MTKRYCNADRQGRVSLLDEMEAVADLYRKTVVRLMNRRLERTPLRTQ